jgi:hypothetical protein
VPVVAEARRPWMFVGYGEATCPDCQVTSPAPAGSTATFGRNPLPRRALGPSFPADETRLPHTAASG